MLHGDVKHKSEKHLFRVKKELDDDSSADEDLKLRNQIP